MDEPRQASYPGEFVRITQDSPLMRAGLSYANVGVLVGVGIPILANKCRNEAAFRRINSYYAIF
jgi:hypothetical protein